MLGAPPRNFWFGVMMGFGHISGIMNRICMIEIYGLFQTDGKSLSVLWCFLDPFPRRSSGCHFDMLKFWIFDNSGGAVPCMCSPKWNLRWYSDSWDTFRKMMYYICQSPYLAQERSYEPLYPGMWIWGVPQDISDSGWWWHFGNISRFIDWICMILI